MAEMLRFDLNKQKFGNPIIYGRVSDGNEYKKSVQFLMDGKPFDLTDWVVSFEGITAHFKNKIMDTVGVTLTDAPNGKFDYVFPNASFSQPGKYERAYFSAVKGDKRVTTADFVLIVLDYADIDAQEAEDFISEYNRLVVELNTRFNSAIDQMDADYDDLDQRVTTLQQAMTTYEASVESTSSEAIQAVNDALEQLGTYYTKTESDNRFLAKSSVATQAEAEAGTIDTKYMTPAKTKMAIDVQIAEIARRTRDYVANLTLLAGSVPNDRPFKLTRQGDLCLLEFYVTGLEGRNINAINIPTGFRIPEAKNFFAKCTGGTYANAWLEATTGNVIIGTAYDATTGPAFIGRDLKKADVFEASIAYRTEEEFPENI